jgi:hypothetical protein
MTYPLYENLPPICSEEVLRAIYMDGEHYPEGVPRPEEKQRADDQAMLEAGVPLIPGTVEVRFD